MLRPKLFLVVAVLFGSLTVSTAPSADADTNCGSPPDDLALSHVRSATATHNGRTATISLTHQTLSDHSFANMRSGYRSGDLTWVDRSNDGGTTWTQCGPFNRRVSNDLSNYHNWMRACARWNGMSLCTSWYYDNS